MATQTLLETIRETMIAIAISNDLVTGVLASLISGVVLMILGWLFGHTVWVKVVNTFYWLSNREIQLSAKRVDTFDLDDNSVGTSVDYDLYRELQDQSSAELTNPEYLTNAMRLSVEDIPARVNITIEQRFNFSGTERTHKGYKVLIGMESDLRVGYRSVDSLREFQNFSELASDVIARNYLHSEGPSTSIISCELKKGIPAGTDKFNDEDLDILGDVQDSILYLTFQNPRNLIEGVRKHFGPM